MEKLQSIDREVDYFDRMISGAEKIVRPWKIAVLAVVIGWAITVISFVWLWAQYDYVSYQQDGEGYNNINFQSEGNVNNNGTAGQSSNEQEIE